MEHQSDLNPPADDTIAEAATAHVATAHTASRRGFVRTAALVATGAVGAVALGSSDPAAAAGATQYGAANDAGFDQTSLASVRSNGGRTLSVTNVGSDGFAIAGEADYMYGGYANEAGINATAGQTGAILTGGQTGADLRRAETGVYTTGRIAAHADGGDIGVLTAAGKIAIQGSALGDDGVGLQAVAGKYGAVASGRLSPIWLQPRPGAPTPGTLRHESGEIVCEQTAPGEAVFWACITSGTPGTWRRISDAPPVAPSFHAFTPHRVYDSRWVDGPLSAGRNRQVSVKDGRSLLGAIDLADLVPPGATVISYNLTIAGTIGTGFLAITPAGAVTFAASAINWSSSGFVVANASTVNTDANREVIIWVGGGGSAQFIIDIVGYFR